MDPITIGLLAGAGTGLGKGLLDQEKEKRNRKMEAQIAAYSPWSGMGAQRVQEADTLGAVMQGGMTGAMMGQMMGGGSAGAAGANAAPGGMAANRQFYNPWQGMVA